MEKLINLTKNTSISKTLDSILTEKFVKNFRWVI